MTTTAGPPECWKRFELQVGVQATTSFPPPPLQMVPGYRVFRLWHRRAGKDGVVVFPRVR